MAEVKDFAKYLEYFFYLFWGFNLVDVLGNVLNLKHTMSNVSGILDESIRTGFALIGIIFAILRIRQALKKWKYENQTRELNHKKQILELRELEDAAFYASEMAKARLKKQLRNESEKN